MVANPDTEQHLTLLFRVQPMIILQAQMWMEVKDVCIVMEVCQPTFGDNASLSLHEWILPWCAPVHALFLVSNPWLSLCILPPRLPVAECPCFNCSDFSAENVLDGSHDSIFVFFSLVFIFYSNLLTLLSQSYDLLPDHLILLSAFFLLGWQLLAKVLNRSSNVPTSWDGCLSGSQLLHQHHTRRMIVKPVFETLANNWLTQLHTSLGQGTFKIYCSQCFSSFKVTSLSLW